MASHLDLEEQEQIEELKHFWRRYGPILTWALIVVLGAYSAWTGWQYWQRRQGLTQGSLSFAGAAAPRSNTLQVLAYFISLELRCTHQ